MSGKNYLDKNLIQNSALACLLITYFVKKYEILSADLDRPDLLKILLVLPLIWHKESCILINKRNNTTKLLDKIETENQVYIISNFKRWPSGYKYTSAPKEMISAINRLAYWFKNHSTAELYLMLLGK
ncbi:MAG: hypothetical protein GAK29_03176 [Acinetobacter bereziniae]|uniref:Uncharacterized protein n=1 Tax=Acinetobacter bereziniae TaxID=106648 RepID=A0A833ULU3_ACIBZ|nr:MAG: hypothetical protein GAK29_03176 [Acinetobacter bereziniae]